MAALQCRWHRIFPVYLGVAVAMLAAACVVPDPLHWILLMSGILLLAGFVPLVGAIYFMRGYLGNVPH